MSSNDKRYQEIKQLWYKIFRERGLDYCHRCGYDKYIGAIDHHHKERKGTWNNRDRRISQLILKMPTPERVKELDDCISFCATCHREFHIEEGTVGKPLNGGGFIEEDLQLSWIDFPDGA